MPVQRRAACDVVLRVHLFRGLGVGFRGFIGFRVSSSGFRIPLNQGLVRDYVGRVRGLGTLGSENGLGK